MTEEEKQIPRYARNDRFGEFSYKETASRIK